MRLYRILFLGDVVGRPGRRAVRDGLPILMDRYEPLFVVANGENAASGIGVTAELAEDLLGFGVDVITLGNHAFHRKDIGEYLNSGAPIVRPANFPVGSPGVGRMFICKSEISLAVLNVCGRVSMEPVYDDPFRAVDTLLTEAKSKHVLLDFHAEATSEKVAMAYWCDGRASAVVGTHTHVPTADERILPRGTAAITDVGMCGCLDGVIGVDREIILRRFTTAMPERFEVQDGHGVLCGVIIEVETETGRATSIQRVRFDEK